jgi:hypothetical protein
MGKGLLPTQTPGGPEGLPAPALRDSELSYLFKRLNDSPTPSLLFPPSSRLFATSAGSAVWLARAAAFAAFMESAIFSPHAATPTDKDPGISSSSTSTTATTPATSLSSPCVRGPATTPLSIFELDKTNATRTADVVAVMSAVETAALEREAIEAARRSHGIGVS